MNLKRFAALAVLLSCTLAIGSLLRAADPVKNAKEPIAGCCPHDLLRCCPDDYCPKPLPCIRTLGCCRCPDTYCPKPLPCIRCLGCCRCPDTYCRKPCPPLCRPFCADWYTCGLSSWVPSWVPRTK